MRQPLLPKNVHGPLGRTLNSSESMELSKQLLASFLSHLHDYSIIDTDYMYLPKFCLTVLFLHTLSQYVLRAELIHTN